MTAADAALTDALEPGPEESLDRLCGDWHIFQLRRGHRFSTDDMLVARLAAHLRPDADRHLDLGAGTGSVGLLSLWRRRNRGSLVMIEAQVVSHGLARRTVAHNGLGDRVELRHGDLRDPAMLPESEHASYPLVTGSPPYIPLGSGVVSPHPQRAACRMELRGDVFDYARTAARALAPDGVFCLVHSAVDPRPEQAIEAAGLQLLSRQDVYFRRNRAPTIALWAAAWTGTRQDLDPIVVREPDGQWTQEYLDIRQEMGAP
jgi:tRNA1(Val) A37 N6-methylase TrmN6